MTNKTTIALKNECGTFTVSVDKTTMVIGDVVDELIVPLLLGVGYSDKTIGRRIASEVVGSNLEDVPSE